MPGHGSQFELKMDEAVLALLTARNTEEAADKIGVSASTLLRWQKEPEFQAALREAKRLSFAQSMARLHQMANAAITTLGKVMIDPTTPPATKVKAAESILSHTQKAIEIEDFEARLVELERKVEHQIQT